MERYASVSFGKDSLCMLLMLIAREEPPDEVVFYNSGMEFEALYRIRDRVLPLLERHGIRYTELAPEHPFLYDMFEREVHARDGSIHYGYSWCGGRCRWGTSQKTQALARHNRDGIDMVGIAFDEPERLGRDYRPNKRFPLYQWGVTEAQALQYCYKHGYRWLEGGLELYSLLDRVSCWCCRNKNLRELENIYHYLPHYWQGLCRLQERTHLPYRSGGETVFDLQKRFERNINPFKPKNYE